MYIQLTLMGFIVSPLLLTYILFLVSYSLILILADLSLLQLYQLLLSPKLPCWLSCCILASFSAPCSTAGWGSSWLGVVPPPAAPDILLLAMRAHKVMGKLIAEKTRHFCVIKASLAPCIPQWSWHPDVPKWILFHPLAGWSLRRILLQSAGSRPQHEFRPVQHCAGRLGSF